ncbi:hypothetical protein KCP69_04640 [Salmonella enterica subsp. enterica]|nr:hypothetical protein KCP69_04640 [Salmonella enterica subsp. enterica]
MRSPVTGRRRSQVIRAAGPLDLRFHGASAIALPPGMLVQRALRCCLSSPTYAAAPAL